MYLLLKTYSYETLKQDAFSQRCLYYEIIIEASLSEVYFII